MGRIVTYSTHIEIITAFYQQNQWQHFISRVKLRMRMGVKSKWVVSAEK